MTVDEYALAVEEAIEERNLPIWKIYDLRLLLRFAQQRGKVWRIDEILLNQAGKLRSEPVYVRPKQRAKQGSLF